MRVLLLHNRYRQPGGEERLIDLITALLDQAGVENRLLTRDSAELTKLQAGLGMVRGGLHSDQVARTIAEFKPDVVHAHNLNPSLGYRALAVAKQSGARVVMHLHNFRIFCAIGTSYRDGRPCFRCQGRDTWPGVRLRCRGGALESATYGFALSAHQQRLFDLVDQFITPSAFAADQLMRLGLPTDQTTILPNPAPSDALVANSTAADGQYALYVGRLSSEKGIDTALAAAATARVPLVVAGAGIEGDELAFKDDYPQVSFLGAVDQDKLRDLRAKAAVALVPSRGPEVFPFAALEAIAAGLPVLASGIGGLAEIVSAEQTLTPGDRRQWANSLSSMMESPEKRRRLGEENLSSVRARFSQDIFNEGLLKIYAQ